MSQDLNNEIFDDEKEEPEFFTLPVLQIVDSTHMVPQLIQEIQAALNSLNSPSLDEEVNHIADLIRNHSYKNAQHLLAPRQIWDLIIEHNSKLAISETFTQEQEDEFLRILSFGTDYSEVMEFGFVGEDDLKWDDDDLNNLDDFES